MAQKGGAITTIATTGRHGSGWFGRKNKGKGKGREAPDSGAEDASEEMEGKKSNPFIWLLDKSERMVYLLVGACFVIAALLSLIYGVLKFYDSTRQLVLMGFGALHITSGSSNSPPEVIITFVSDLLLTLIIMEVLGTVTNYLESRKLALRPFLYIGIISATRGILSVGARLSVSDSLPADEFRNLIVELAIDAAVIIALGVTISLARKFLEKEEADADARKRVPTGKTAPAPTAQASASGATILLPAPPTQQQSPPRELQ